MIANDTFCHHTLNDVEFSNFINSFLNLQSHPEDSGTLNQNLLRNKLLNYLYW